MPTEPAYLLHAVAGSIAIILYWAAIAQRKEAALTAATARCSW